MCYYYNSALEPQIPTAIYYARRQLSSSIDASFQSCRLLHHDSVHGLCLVEWLNDSIKTDNGTIELLHTMSRRQRDASDPGVRGEGYRGSYLEGDYVCLWFVRCPIHYF